MLLLADKELQDRLAERLTGRPMVAVADPYDALEEMGRRSFPVIVLSPTAATPTGEGEFAALCRAARRLQHDAHVVALCPPRLETEVHALVGETLDDYFIYPPSPTDLRILVESQPPIPPAQPQDQTAAVQPVEPPAVSLAEPPGVSFVEPLSRDDISRLVGATFSRADLETALVQMVAARVRVGLEWVDIGEKGEKGEKGPAGPAGEVLLRLDGQPARVLVATQPVRIDSATQAMLTALSHILPALSQAAQRTEALHHLAITDDLTGAYNRRYFYHATDQILRQAAAKNFRVTLLLYDIDDFKTYNDQYSYAVGDDILREMAVLMRQITREHDIVARIGGDEFAVLFWDKEQPRLADSKPPDSAYVLARRFLAALQKHAFPSLGPGAEGVLTISGGLASFPADGTSCRELLRKADQAIKAVKRAGKKGIRIVGPATNETNSAPSTPKGKPKRQRPRPATE